MQPYKRKRNIHLTKRHDGKLCNPSQPNAAVYLCSKGTECPVGIKLATFDSAKAMLGHANKAYDEELVKWQRGERIKDSSSGLI